MFVKRLVAILCFHFSISEIESSLFALKPTVYLPRYGILKGSTAKTAWTHRTIYQFLGVKYAESPSGDQRFKAPVSVKPWCGIRDAQNFGMKCPVLKDLLKMSDKQRKRIDVEDCLSMEIYSPKLTASLPVMVYVHGGSFYLNSARDSPPNYLLERDVILVSVQYRLDALEFLSTNSDDIPGNAGLMDVQLALTFIKENIKYFGGNPNKITLFGHSSGAAMVSALTISPAVPPNLFHRVIIHSGSVLSKWSVTTDPVTDARDIAEVAGLDPTQSINVLNKAFIKMDVVDLLKAVDQYQKNFGNGPMRFGARSLSVGGPNNLLPDLPQNIISSSQYNKTIPMIIGTTKDDGSYISLLIYDFLRAINLTKVEFPLVGLLLQFMCDFLKIGDLCPTLQSIVGSTFWTEDELASADFTKIASGLSDFLGTAFFKAPALGLALNNARLGANTFLYTFDYQGEYTRFGYEEGIEYPFTGGVTHSDDLMYLFPYPTVVADLNKADIRMAEKFLDLWTSFATNGKPQIHGQKRTEDKFSWSPIQIGTFGPYAHIDEKLTIGNDYTKELVGHVPGRTYADYKTFVDMLLSLLSQ